MDQVEFEFPDEKSKKEAQNVEKSPEFEIEIEDDIPPDDRNRKPVDKETVKKLEVEVDELDKYSLDAKEKLIKMKKVWHDERRAKEEADRERHEALKVTKQLMEENRSLKSKLSTGEEEYVSASKQNAVLELDSAKKAYKDAYDAGDSDQLVEAQEQLARILL